MPENFETKPENKNEGKENDLGKFEKAIRAFLAEQTPATLNEKRNKGERPADYFSDFDVSNPRPNDMKAWQSGDYEIRNFRISPTDKKDIRGFHFNVGDTEFHIMGKAAERVYELLKGE
ncbi:MAG: hypothetical protein PHU56_00270 [Candidatus Pacebacteria bacterium]|nr:hypothetical protein [Candidatus Paceibacterota bacterium]